MRGFREKIPCVVVAGWLVAVVAVALRFALLKGLISLVVAFLLGFGVHPVIAFWWRDWLVDCYAGWPIAYATIVMALALCILTLTGRHVKP